MKRSRIFLVCFTSLLFGTGIGTAYGDLCHRVLGWGHGLGDGGNVNGVVHPFTHRNDHLAEPSRWQISDPFKYVPQGATFYKFCRCYHNHATIDIGSPFSHECDLGVFAVAYGEHAINDHQHKHHLWNDYTNCPR